MPVYIGIDPGASGGLASISLDGIEAVSMPATPRDICEWFIWYESKMKPIAVIEKVQGHIGKANPGSAMFKFGFNTGMLTGFLVARQIPYDEITPQRWQKGVGMVPRKKKETKVLWKNRLKARAQQLFPQEKITLATADALLIAYYCKLKHEGKV